MVNILKLAIRSLAYFKRLNLLLLSGVAVSTAILCGSFIIGDSVNYSLDRIRSKRLGNIRYTVENNNYFFTDGLSDGMSKSLDTKVTPVLALKTALTFDNMSYNDINLYGISTSFFDDDSMGLSEDEIVINNRLAVKAGINPGDEVLLRIDRKGILSRDTPFSKADTPSVGRRFIVKFIIAGKNPGDPRDPKDLRDLSLKNNQILPYNVFIGKDNLGSLLGLYDLSNLILIDGSKSVDLNKVQNALKASFYSDDAGFYITEKESGEIIINSKRIFIKEKVGDIFKDANMNFTPVLTYFANGIKTSKNSSGYFFITGADNYPGLEKNLDDNQIVLSDVLAAELKAKTGDDVEIEYYAFDGMFNFSVKSASFKVAGIKKMSFFSEDLTPQYPGFAHSQNCSDWAPSVPIDLSRIEKTDEDFWSKYKATPRAMISYNAAKNLWQNEYGELTSLRFKDRKYKAGSIESVLKNGLDPSEYGITITDQKKSAAGATVDFTGLFFSLSFLVIAACILIIVILVLFSIESRHANMLVLNALGFSKALVSRILLTEWMLLTAAGCMAGAFLGILFSSLILSAVRTVWIDMVGTSDIYLNITPFSLISGGVSGFIVSTITIVAAVVMQIRKKKVQADTTNRILKKKPRRILFIVIISTAVLLLLSIVFFTFIVDNSSTGFFISGIISLALYIMMFYRWSGINSKPEKLIGVPGLASANLRHNRTKNILTATVLTISIFLLVSIGINRKISVNLSGSKNGTGGFEYLVNLTVPYSSKTDRKLENKILENSDIVKIRLKEGDDSSCLNLNRITDFTLYGIEPADFIKNERFSFVKSMKFPGISDPWEILDTRLGGGVIPAIADQTVITWSLGKKVGDILEITDEKGAVIKLKLVGGLENSIFQGKIIISDKNLKKLFPSISGYSIFLVDTPVNGEIEEYFINSFREYGVETNKTGGILAGFYSVESTYISVFFILGILAFVMGSIGMSILIFKNVSSRLKELAVLKVLGFGKTKIISILFLEYGYIYLIGTLAGILISFTALLPALFRGDSDLSMISALFTVSGVVVAGFVLITVSIIVSIPRHPVRSLNNQ